MELQSDAELAQRYLRGEAEATAVVDGWLAAAAWSFRRRLLVDWDDLLQEIRLEVLRLLRKDSFRGESRLKTYLWQVACHTCLDAVRRQRRRTFVGLEELESLEAKAASPYDALAGRQAAELALRALGTLSDECRELWSQLLRGVTYRELGERLGVSEGALRVRAHRCRKSAVDAYRAATASVPATGDKRAVS